MSIKLTQLELKQIEQARQYSIDNNCTKHVNAVMVLDKEELKLFSLSISDWYDTNSTIISFTNGRQHGDK